MRFAGRVSGGVVLLLMAQAAMASPRATASAGASLTIIKAPAARLQLPASVWVGRTGHHSIRLIGPRPLESLSVTDNEPPGPGPHPALFHLRLTPSGPVLELDLAELPDRDGSLPIQVTYHQY